MSFRDVLTSSSVGLGNVDNTSDANKPVSIATTTALALKLNTTAVPYTSYQALVTQVTIGAPSAVIFNNTLGATITWARTSTGLYTATAGSAVFTANKTVVVMSQPLATLVSYFYVNTSTTIITFTTGVLALGVAAPTDGLWTNVLIEIRVYS